MADFCQQCSVENFGEDMRDLAGLGETADGMGWGVLCEGCGMTTVDNSGRCIADWCPEHGGDRVDTHPSPVIP